MNNLVLIDAVYINKSGGKVLLEYLIKTIVIKRVQNNFFFLLDNRIVISNTTELEMIHVRYLSPSEKERIDFYKKNIEIFNSIFCFSNVPPPIVVKEKKVLVYFHNVLLVNFFNSNLSYFEIINLILKKWYIKFSNCPNYIWVTQASSIKYLLVDKMGFGNNLVKVIPFFDITEFERCNISLVENYYNYLYVADSSKQKNHLKLLLAWERFTNLSENTNYTLHLTLPENSSKEVLQRIEYLKKSGRKIFNHKNCSREEILGLYKKCNYFVFPSLAESFGLPLIEAASAGCKIISSNLPYVFNVVEPSLVFDPYDENSIFDSLIFSKDYSNVKNSKLLVKNNIEELLNEFNHV